MKIVHSQIGSRNPEAFPDQRFEEIFPDIIGEYRILSITPALAGWWVAFAQPFTRVVWFKPIAAWALVEPRTKPRCVLPMVGARNRPSMASLVIVDEGPSLIVPPGHHAEWDKQFGWILSPPRETWPTPSGDPEPSSEEW